MDNPGDFNFETAGVDASIHNPITIQTTTAGPSQTPPEPEPSEPTPMAPPPTRPYERPSWLDYGNPAPTKKPEVKSHAKKPAIFSGDRKTLEKFLRDCLIYVHSNRKDFEEEDVRVQFVLSYIDGGEADSWKEYYMKTLIDEDGDVHWPKMGELTSNLRENFAKEDQVEESLRKLETMRQDGRTAEEVVNEFRILKSRAKIEDNALTVRMFRRVLNPSLAMKIMTDPNKHNTLEDLKFMGAVSQPRWFSKAIQYDQIYQDARAAQREDRGSNYKSNDKNRNLRQAFQKGNERAWRNTSNNSKPAPYRDPNAMDIDFIGTTINAMSYEERNEFPKKGLCFNCKQPGHISRDCPKKDPRRSTSNAVNTPRYSQNKPSSGYAKKPDAKEMAKYIRSMNKDKQDELFDEVEKDENLSDKGKDFV
jgi:hypothetical protein